MTEIGKSWSVVALIAATVVLAVGVTSCDGSWLPGDQCPYRSGSSVTVPQPLWTEEECAFACSFNYTFTLDPTTVGCGTCTCTTTPAPAP